ncbi:Holliday junction resolvase RuvX [Corynebacterium caspium]|uniref:Holliday junction resolvase RuvX n=1 Tax=Corynebacterium caspium TaxID=234828 RepID=UPI0003729D64|nr:Holliday junction resolvase RuvX [Corynebacterium caspium]WKD59198.1 Putative Holliday junction resolvase [Corynebacterium caspium DSM 44850]
MKVDVDTPGVADPGPGRRIGIDVGTVRIGVAVSDPAGILATPVETVPRETDFNDPDLEDIDRLLEIIANNQAVEVVVGMPRDLKGNGSRSVLHALDISRRLRRRLETGDTSIPVRMADERLTTVAATNALRACGINARKGRKIIDQAAAVQILQTWLDGRANYLNRMSQEERSQ